MFTLAKFQGHRGAQQTRAAGGARSMTGTWLFHAQRRARCRHCVWIRRAHTHRHARAGYAPSWL